MQKQGVECNCQRLRERNEGTVVGGHKISVIKTKEFKKSLGK